jgi:hypothetical protein
MDRPIEGYSIVIGCLSNRLPLRYKACQYRHIGGALRLAAGDWKGTQFMPMSVNRP